MTSDLVWNDHWRCRVAMIHVIITDANKDSDKAIR